MKKIATNGAILIDNIFWKITLKESPQSIHIYANNRLKLENFKINHSSSYCRIFQNYFNRKQYRGGDLNYTLLNSKQIRGNTSIIKIKVS